MGLFDRFKRRAVTVAVDSAIPPDPAPQMRADATTDEVVKMLRSGNQSASGVYVTPENAMTFGAVLGCVRVLAEGVSSLPLITYERVGRGKERATDHPLYSVLHDSPNDEMTSFQWRETSQLHCTLWGNCYSEIIDDGAGAVRELWPLFPQYMTPKRVQGKLVYEYRDPQAGLITYPKENIFHVPGLSMNGLVGMTMVAIYRETVGLGLTLNRHGAKLFSNGARAGGVLESPGKLSEKAYGNLKSSFNSEYGGVENAGKTIILEEGTKFNSLTMPNDDAQFLQSRQFQVEEVARIFNVQQPMIGALGHATFTNIEQLSLNHVIYTMRPWYVRWEQVISHRLLLPRERVRYFSEFLVDGLLRGDTETRYTAYASAINTGWMTRNEVREIENKNPDDPTLDKYLQPLNMTTTDNAAVTIKGTP
jgi:HK97 family phage portal protein